MAPGLGPGIGAALRPIAHILLVPQAMQEPVASLGVDLVAQTARHQDNLLTLNLAQKFRVLSIGGPTTVRLVLAFEAPVPVNALALLATNAEADTTVRWVGSADPAFSVIGYESCPIDAPLPHWPQPSLGDWEETLHLTWCADVQTYQYWMAEITFAHAYYQAGGLIVGKGYQPTIDVQDGAGIGWDDPSTIRETVGSKRFVDRRPKTRRYTCQLKAPSEREAYGDLFRLERLLGTTEPLLVSIDPHPENPFLHDQTFVATLDALAPMTNSNVTLYDKQLTFREQR